MQPSYAGTTCRCIQTHAGTSLVYARPRMLSHQAHVCRRRWSWKQEHVGTHDRRNNACCMTLISACKYACMLAFICQQIDAPQSHRHSAASARASTNVNVNLNANVRLHLPQFADIHENIHADIRVYMHPYMCGGMNAHVKYIKHARRPTGTPLCNEAHPNAH
jgi:hypothetical protein